MKCLERILKKRFYLSFTLHHGDVSECGTVASHSLLVESAQCPVTNCCLNLHSGKFD